MTSDNNRRLAVLILSGALLPGCNNADEPLDLGGNTLTTPDATNIAVFVESFALDAAADLQRPAIVSRDVAVPAGGTVRVECDWSSATNDLDLVVTRNDCRSGIAAWNGECTVHDIDRSSLTKPARVDFTLPAAATVRVYVYNFSQAPEAAVLQVLLRP